MDYEKAYKEALENDERIRKWLIEMVEELRKANPTNAKHNGNCSEAIAYLEKQKDEVQRQFNLGMQAGREDAMYEMEKEQKQQKKIIEINGIRYKEVPAKTNDKICKDCDYFLDNGSCNLDDCPCTCMDNILERIPEVDLEGELKDMVARNAASIWCRCFKCDGIINATSSKCDKEKLLTCRKWYDGYRTALLALGDKRIFNARKEE